MTSDTTVVALRQPDAVEDPLTAVLRSGARRLLAQAVEAEAEAFLAAMRELRLPDGRERLVRHGLGPGRLGRTGAGGGGGRLRGGGSQAGRGGGEGLVRHGLGPERLMQTGIGPVAVQRVKLRDL